MFDKNFLAFALLHISIPAISVAFFDASPFWIIGSLIFSVAAIETLRATSSVFVVVILCLLSGVAFTLNLMLGTSYYMQGEGFNDAFFYHLNAESLIIATRAYSGVLYPSLFVSLLAVLAPIFFHKTSSKRVWPAVPVWLLWLLALAGNFPIYSLASYQKSVFTEVETSGFSETELSGSSTSQSKPEFSTQVTEDLAPRAIVEPDPPPKNQPGAQDETTPGKNIILIYAESFEALYFDKELFGDLTPNIRNLSVGAHRFTNIVQASGTSWTIAGIVASQCGFPLKVSSHLASNSTIASVDAPYPDEICLADILSDKGYETVYMGGDPLWFAGKENFLRTHGYKRMFGDEELSSLLPDKEYKSGWGLFDDSLFDMALDELHSLEKDSQPYFLTVQSMDTHHPEGVPSRSCKTLADNQDPMSNAIFCSDQVISGFISEVMKVVDMKNTIIVLFSDHLSMRNTLWDKLKQNRQRRRLTFMVFDNTPGTISDVRGTHFDVAPTLLEAAGIAGHSRLGIGVSLFTRLENKPGLNQMKEKMSSTPSLLKPDVSAKETGVRLSRTDMTLSFGELTLRANDAGQDFVSGMYLAVLDEEGNVIDAIYANDYQYLAENLNGTFIIGVSVMPDPPYQSVYFYGRISPDGRGITQHEFKHDVYLNVRDVWIQRP